VAWFVAHSLATILGAFVLGMVIGWLWWGRAWRRVPLGESEAVRTVSARYASTIAARDAEIVRLSNVSPATATPPTRPSGAPSDATLDVTADGGQEAVPDDGLAGRADQDQPPPSPIPAKEQVPTEPDDLERIEGVGPRIAAALASAGLRTYREVADADVVRLTAALRAAGLAFAPTVVTWPLQARLLADGDETGLRAVKAELTAGRARGAQPATAPSGTQTERSVTGSARTEPVAAGPAPAAPMPTDASGAAPTGSGPDLAGGSGPDLAGESGPAAQANEAEGGDRDAAEDREDEEDELERIEGIGPRIATALRRAGIRSYRELAEADALTLQSALSASGLRFAPSLPTWSRQAALLADGDEAGFLALTRTLVPDREGGRPSS
jgi:predicted flap endonuclease-1-like 5' DNA nuclease